jgi:hypothetical protein
MALVNSFAEFYLDLSVTALKGYNLIAAKRFVVDF